MLSSMGYPVEEAPYEVPDFLGWVSLAPRDPGATSAEPDSESDDGMTHDSDKTVDMSVPETQPPPTPVVAAPPPPATVSIKKEDIKEENLMDED